MASAITKFAGTGSDETTSMILKFPKGETHGLASTSLRVICTSKLRMLPGKLTGYRLHMIQTRRALLDPPYAYKARKQRSNYLVQHISHTDIV